MQGATSFTTPPPLPALSASLHTCSLQKYGLCATRRKAYNIRRAGNTRNRASFVICGILYLFFGSFAWAKGLVNINDHDDTSSRSTGATASCRTTRATLPVHDGRGYPRCDAPWTQLATMTAPFTPTSRKSHLRLSHKQYSKVLNPIRRLSTRLTPRNRSLEPLQASDAQDEAVSATIWTRKMKMNIRTELVRPIITPQVRGVFPFFLCALDSRRSVVQQFVFAGEPSFIAEASFVRAPLNSRVAARLQPIRRKEKGHTESLEGVPLQVQEAMILEDLLFVLMVRHSSVPFHPSLSLATYFRASRERI